MSSILKISVIVPVYKAEKTLSVCVESIRNQSIDSFELLLIDDGSPDQSGAMCDDYAVIDSRIRVFHQQNSGVSAARNKGLENARGEYICFVDSDDWVKVDYLKELYDSLLVDEKKAGLIIHGFIRCSSDASVLSEVRLMNRILYASDFDEAFTKDAICELGYSCSKLYQLNLLREHNICFNEQVSCCEDLLFMLEYLLCCDYISYGESMNYVYIKYTSSLSVVVNSFSSECVCFIQYKLLLERVMNKYMILPADMKSAFRSLMICFQRALKADYQSDKRICKKQRLENIECLVDRNHNWIKAFYNPAYKTDKVGKFLLLNHWFYCYDLWVKLIFKLRIKAMFLGPI